MDQRVLLLSALGQSPPALLPQALEFMLSSEVRTTRLGLGAGLGLGLGLGSGVGLGLGLGA